MWASRPTAWPAHAATHFIDADFDAAFSSRVLFGRRDPTYPLIACQRGKVGPKVSGDGIRLDSFSEISRKIMNRTTREFLNDHTSKYASFRPTLNQSAPTASDLLMCYA